MQTDAFPFEISPSTPSMELHHREAGESWLEFCLFHSGDGPLPRVRVTFERCVAVRSDWAAYEGQHGIGFLTDSPWIRRLNEWQRKHYPGHPKNLEGIRHYYFAGHDAVCEVLAEGHRWHYVSAPR